MNSTNTGHIDSSVESWPKIREKRLEIDDHQCANCDKSDSLQVHHVVPKSLGGVDEVSNLRTLCTDCHDKAHGSSIGLITGEQTSSETRWIPTIDTMRWLVSNVNHPFDRLVVVILAKTGIGVGELASLALSDIYLRDGGFGLTSTVERPTHPFFLIYESEKGPGSGTGKRLCDTLIPIDPELQICLKKYLAIRPDTESSKLLVSTGDAWGKPVSHDILHHTIEKSAREVGLYETGAGADSNLTPTVFRQFFADRYQGQPSVRDHLLGKKEKMPFTQGRIATDYRESVYSLLS